MADRRTKANKSQNNNLELQEGSIFDVVKEELIESRGLITKHYINQNRPAITARVSHLEAESAFHACREIYERVHRAHIARKGMNESDTESELIDKILPILGFHFLHRTRQDAGGVPDYVLFADEKSKDEALGLEDKERYRIAIGILEAKSFDKKLGHLSKRETPGISYSRQIYLYLADALNGMSKAVFNWGILTDGIDWRLYCRNARSDKFLSVNLKAALNNLEDFKLFLGMFSRTAFLPDSERLTLLDQWRSGSEYRQRELETNLQKRVYVLIEWIAQGFWENEFNRINDLVEMSPVVVYKKSLILLYRLMFILYAEACGLLPTYEHRRGARVDYRRDYSLQRFGPLLRENAYEPEDDVASNYWYKLTTLFEVIDGSNEKLSKRLNIPRFNGGLFDSARHSQLGNLPHSWRLGDWTVQETMKRLMFDITPSSVRETIPIGNSETIDYATLTVKQLGTIYEGLLEHKPVLTKDNRIEVRPESDERWLSGSYYTPDWVVDYILEETLRPLLDEIENSETVKSAKERDVENNSFADAVLKLKIIDPAMGSGHFLVGATVFLADEIAYHPTTKLMVFEKPAGNMTEAEAEVVYWRRQVVESCIYGVDKNELAVELAKLSLWLTCVTPMKPLSFLDHHLKWGDSLTGRFFEELQGKYITEGLDKTRRNAYETLTKISAIPSDEFDQVKEKEWLYTSEVAIALDPYEALLDLLTQRDFEEDRDEAVWTSKLEAYLAQTPLPYRQTKPESDPPLHFELAFPEVFPPNGEMRGFDAVIGNPPYVRQESLRELKRYLQRNYQTYNGKADLYVYFVERAFQLLRPGGRLGMIFSNKWMRASYGGELRKFIREKQVEKMVDFGELKVFATSSTFPMIMTACNNPVAEMPVYTAVKKVPGNAEEVQSVVSETAFPLAEEAMAPAGFALVKKDLTDVFEKMKVAGKPLGEYVEGKIYRGIITGFNKAFAISAEQRERLINKDPKSAEIIVPWVVGDDVRKWRVNYRNRYLILTKIGVEIEEYPTIFAHLQKHKESLEKRWDKGNHWWELRACDYYSEFTKSKIIWPDIAKESRFAYEPDSLYSNNACYFHPNANDSLLCILNSHAVWQYLLRLCPVLGDPDKGGRLAQHYIYIKTIPIPCDKSGWIDLTPLGQQALELKVRLNASIGLAERRRLEGQLTEVERSLDVAVYKLYGLTDKEIRVLEKDKR